MVVTSLLLLTSFVLVLELVLSVCAGWTRERVRLLVATAGVETVSGSGVVRVPRRVRERERVKDGGVSAF